VSASTNNTFLIKLLLFNWDLNRRCVAPNHTNASINMLKINITITSISFDLNEFSFLHKCLIVKLLIIDNASGTVILGAFGFPPQNVQGCYMGYG
jgi:hypothetical protein